MTSRRQRLLAAITLVSLAPLVAFPVVGKAPYVQVVDALAIGTGYAPAHVGSNAALKSYTSNFLQALVANGTPTVVWRDSFYQGGTGPSVAYSYQAAPCAAPDDGAQVSAASGGCWIASLPRVPDVQIWGAVCDRRADDAPPFNAASAAISALGGGDLGICRAGALIDSADLYVAPNVNLVGGFAIGGVRQGGNYTSVMTTPFALVMNPAHSLRIGSHASWHGSLLLRKGLVGATDYHSGFASLAAFAGTGVILGDASGNPGEAQTVSDVMILGFNLGFNTNNESRFTVHDIKADDNNVIQSMGVYDVANMYNIEGWPFAITGSWANPSRTITNVSADSSGRIQITVPLISSANPSQDSLPQVGEPIWGAGIVGVPGANGQQTVAAASSDTKNTYVSFANTSFSGAWTSGGQLISWTGRRPGVGFYEDNTTGFEASNIFFYGYQTAYYFGSNTAGPKCGCSFDDNSSLNDPNTIGINFNGQRGIFTGTFMSSVGQKFIMNSSSGDDTFIIGAPVISPNNGRSITVNQGNLSIIGANLGGEVRMASGSTSLRLIDVNQGANFNITGDSPSDLSKVSVTAGRAGATLLKPASPFGSYPLGGATTLGSNQVNQIVYATNAPWTLTLPDSNAVPAGTLEAVVNNSASGVVAIGVQNNNGLDADGSAGVPAGGRLTVFADGFGNWRTLAASWQQTLTLSAAPTAASAVIPTNQCRIVKNTNDGTLKNYCNDNGTLRSVALQ